MVLYSTCLKFLNEGMLGGMLKESQGIALSATMETARTVSKTLNMEMRGTRCVEYSVVENFPVSRGCWRTVSHVIFGRSKIR